VGLVSILQAGRRDFLDAASVLSTLKPRSGWSVLECVEHVVVVEERHLEWIVSATEITPKRDAEKEARLFSMMRSRLTKVEAPEVFLPHGRFTTIEAALAAFQAARDSMVEAVRERGDAIYARGVNHPYFGDVNGAELVQLADGHARRHAEQIREVCEGAE
jgi:hypothetical protein